MSFPYAAFHSYSPTLDWLCHTDHFFPRSFFKIVWLIESQKHKNMRIWKKEKKSTHTSYKIQHSKGKEEKRRKEKSENKLCIYAWIMNEWISYMACLIFFFSLFFLVSILLFCFAIKFTYSTSLRRDTVKGNKFCKII